jgi:hypothetical protein
VFGGYGPSTILGDHWELAGETWAQVDVALRPAARGRSAMVFDSLRGRAVLFGGELPGPADDTWEWDGASWTRMAPAVSPPGRFEHALAFDAARGVTVLFGGIGGPIMGDTWTYDGRSWTQRIPPTAPLSRWGHAMAFDAARAEVVLFGGAGGLGQVLGDTWVWDGASWTQRQPTTSPAARADHAMAYDPSRGRVVMFGGGFGGANDTWEWDGGDWRQRTTQAVPVSRGRHALAFDSARRTTVLFGGSTLGPNLADAWDHGPTVPARVIAFGAGCAGTAGTPALASGLPWLGDRVTLTVAPIPSGAPTAVWFGSSNVHWQGIALPLDLTFFGLTGCRIHASIDLFFAAQSSGQVATVAVLLPTSASLLGAEVHDQAIVIDRNANPFGAVLSQALTLRLGGR